MSIITTFLLLCIILVAGAMADEIKVSSGSSVTHKSMRTESADTSSSSSTSTDTQHSASDDENLEELDSSSMIEKPFHARSKGNDLKLVATQPKCQLVDFTTKDLQKAIGKLQEKSFFNSLFNIEDLSNTFQRKFFEDVIPSIDFNNIVLSKRMTIGVLPWNKIHYQLNISSVEFDQSEKSKSKFGIRALKPIVVLDKNVFSTGFTTRRISGRIMVNVALTRHRMAIPFTKNKYFIYPGKWDFWNPHEVIRMKSIPILFDIPILKTVVAFKALLAYPGQEGVHHQDHFPSSSRALIGSLVSTLEELVTAHEEIPASVLFPLADRVLGMEIQDVGIRTSAAKPIFKLENCDFAKELYKDVSPDENDDELHLLSSSIKDTILASLDSGKVLQESIVSKFYPLLKTFVQDQMIRPFEGTFKQPDQYCFLSNPLYYKSDEEKAMKFKSEKHNFVAGDARRNH